MCPDNLTTLGRNGVPRVERSNGPRGGRGGGRADGLVSRQNNSHAKNGQSNGRGRNDDRNGFNAYGINYGATNGNAAGMGASFAGGPFSAGPFSGGVFVGNFGSIGNGGNSTTAAAKW